MFTNLAHQIRLRSEGLGEQADVQHLDRAPGLEGTHHLSPLAEHEDVEVRVRKTSTVGAVDCVGWLREGGEGVEEGEAEAEVAGDGEGSRTGEERWHFVELGSGGVVVFERS